MIIVLILYDHLDLLLSEDSCKQREFGAELGKDDRQGGKGKHFFSGPKVLSNLVSKIQYCTPHKTRNIIYFPFSTCIFLHFAMQIAHF